MVTDRRQRSKIRRARALNKFITTVATPPFEEAPIDPAAISNLELWVRASDNTFQDASCTVAAGNTDPVRCWGDKAGGVTADLIAPGDTNRPIRDDTGIGGQPALDFDGIDNRLEISAANSAAIEFDHDSPFSIFSIVNFDNFSQANTMIEKSNDSNSRGYQHYVATSARIFLDFLHLTSNRIGVLGNTTLSANTDYSILLTYSGNGLASGVNFYLSGVVEGKTVLNNTLFGLTTLGGADVVVGTLMGTIEYDGGIADLAVYSKEVSSDERTDILNVYASTRYGI